MDDKMREIFGDDSDSDQGFWLFNFFDKNKN